MVKRAFAVGCHPDDIEFTMSGTLLLLKKAGYEIHYMNVANGSCGTAEYDTEDIIRIRAEEGQNAAKAGGAVFHPSLVNDLEVFYETSTLRKLAAVMREVNPEILLLPSPNDYMEDHMNTCRLAVGAAFFMGMRNYVTDPVTVPVEYDVTLYHALPHGMHDGMRRRVWPGQYVDISTEMDTKLEMLSAHKSQQNWLDVSQGMNAYTQTMVDMMAEVGKMSGKFEYAEGWRRHSHLGYSPEAKDPLRDALGELCIIDEDYEKALEEKKF